MNRDKNNWPTAAIVIAFVVLVVGLVAISGNAKVGPGNSVDLKTLKKLKRPPVTNADCGKDFVADGHVQYDDRLPAGTFCALRTEIDVPCGALKAWPEHVVYVGLRLPDGHLIEEMAEFGLGDIAEWYDDADVYAELLRTCGIEDPASRARPTDDYQRGEDEEDSDDDH